MSASKDILHNYAAQRYSSPHNILRSESIYGHGFQSPGGIEGFKSELGDKMSISSNMKILDIGSGLGGAAFYFAETFGAEVLGLDTSPIMTDLAMSRQPAQDPRNKVRFLNCDIHHSGLDKESFDAIYSRDTLMYENDKKTFFKRCHSLLKSGGCLYIADFCKKRDSPEFELFESKSGYDLKSIDEYAGLIAEAGFDDVSSEDVSFSTRLKLQDDLSTYQAKANDQKTPIAKEDADHIVGRWIQKIQLLEKECLAQGLFIAVKS